MVVTTVCPVRELSATDRASFAERISPTPMTSGCLRRTRSKSRSWSMSSDGVSWGLVSRCTTLFVAWPFSSRLIRSNSRLPSSMVMSLRLSGTIDRSQLITVVFPEPVLPAMQTDTP